MAYEKKTWKIGEEITADKLNHMEDGIAEGGSGGSEKLVVHITETAGEDDTTFTADKTYQEIADAYPNVVVQLSGSMDGFATTFETSVNRIMEADGMFGCAMPCNLSQANTNESHFFIAATKDGYPTYVGDI